MKLMKNPVKIRHSRRNSDDEGTVFPFSDSFVVLKMKEHAKKIKHTAKKAAKEGRAKLRSLKPENDAYRDESDFDTFSSVQIIHVETREEADTYIEGDGCGVLDSEGYIKCMVERDNVEKEEREENMEEELETTGCGVCAMGGILDSDGYIKCLIED